MDFQIVSPITLFPSLITQNWWVSRLSSLFGCVFNFRFYHSIFWFLSDELWKIKTHFKCFQVMDTELWWHFGKHTYLRNPQPVSSQIRFFFLFLSLWVVFFFFLFSFSFHVGWSSSSFFLSRWVWSSLLHPFFFTVGLGLGSLFFSFSSSSSFLSFSHCFFVFFFFTLGLRGLMH